MIKKLFVAIMLAFAIVVSGGQVSKVEAAEVYVGSYSDGTAVYLLTNTVNIQQRSRYWIHFTCRVRAGGDYLHYNFTSRDGAGRNPDPYYINSEGYEGYVFGTNSPVAENIYRYVVNNY